MFPVGACRLESRNSCLYLIDKEQNVVESIKTQCHHPYLLLDLWLLISFSLYRPVTWRGETLVSSLLPGILYIGSDNTYWLHGRTVLN